MEGKKKKKKKTLVSQAVGNELCSANTYCSKLSGCKRVCMCVCALMPLLSVCLH